MFCSQCHRPIPPGKAIVEDQTYYCLRCRRGEPSDIIIAAMNKPAFWVVMIVFFCLFIFLAVVVVLVMFRNT